MRILQAVLMGLACTMVRAASPDISFAPVNADMYRLREPAGERMFVQDDDEPNVLVGEDGWMAERRGRQTVVLAPASEEEPSGYLFVDGELSVRLVEGREIRVPKAKGREDAEAFHALWPAPEARVKGTVSHVDYWKDGHRLRLWFDNPNLTAAVFAQAAILALGLLFVRSWPVRVVGAVLSAGLAVLVILTESRAAVLALVAGGLLMGLTRARKLMNWRVLVPLALVLSLVVGVVVSRQLGNRFTTGLLHEGGDDMSRLPILMEVPRMVVDAPAGWGAHESGRAYVNWYQRKGTCLLEYLVSGHATFLVERSWPMRAAYVFGWLFALSFLAAAAFSGGSPMPVALWAVHGALGFFHPVVAEPVLWLAPLGVLAWMLRSRALRMKVRRPALVAAVLALLLCSGLALAGFCLNRRPGIVPIRASGDAVAVGASAPTTWLLDDGFTLNGGYWWMTGREIRSWFAARPEAPALGLARTAEAVPPDCERLALVGEQASAWLADWERRAERLPALRELVFLSPDCTAFAIPEAVRARFAVTVIQGGLAGRFCGYAQKPDGLQLVRGCELYVPQWLDRVLKIGSPTGD